VQSSRAVGQNLFTPVRFGIFLALLVVAAFPQVIFGVETFVARDYGFFAYPSAYFQRECFWHGELPFWNPYNNCGLPFLAQWNTLPLYPPALLYLLLPLTWALSCFSLLHLWFAGLGMFRLARRWTGNELAAAFAGTVFAFNGFTLNLLMWPSHIATFAWLPWVVLAGEAAWREGGRKILLAAFAGALQMLAGGPETIALTWLFLGALWLQQWVAGEASRTRMFWRLAVAGGLVLALSAMQLLPFLDLVAHAQRETGYTDLRWSVPGSGWANFLVPMAFGSRAAEGIFFQHGQYWTSSYYLGLGTVWLVLLAPWTPNRRRVWLLLLLALAALLCAFGEHTPFYPWLRKCIPQLSFITYPVKFMMAVVFAAPLLAAFALVHGFPGQATLSEAGQKTGFVGKKRLLTVGLLLLLLLGGIVAWTQVAPAEGDDTPGALRNGLSRAAWLVVTGAALFTLARAKKSTGFRFAPLGLLLIVWLDVLTHEPWQNPTVPSAIYQPGLMRERLALKPQPDLGGSRAMLSPAAALAFTRFSVSDPQNNYLAKRLGGCADVNLLDAMPKVDGFFSLAPHNFDVLLTLVYSVSNADWSGLEDFLGVSQGTSATNFLTWQARNTFLPLITAGQQPVFLDDTNALLALGRGTFAPASTVFLPPEARSVVVASNATAATIRAPKFTSRTVDFEVQAGEPVLAVIAQTYYHWWRVEIDGRPAPLLRANFAFQAVAVPPGTHQVHLWYEDRAFEVGAAISVCMWVNCLVSYVALRRRDRNDSVQPQMDTDEHR